ncbi:hypothetical protein [Corynebacterium cystitidis]|uniref:hypothetical protein n=1 Tax=Corynebacterium cystitidis TaxID=35757 RepID=UPI00211F26D3|nr:hypothetical protein [Corynebacterium cystitidis]
MKWSLVIAEGKEPVGKVSALSFRTAESLAEALADRQVVLPFGVPIPLLSEVALSPHLRQLALHSAPDPIIEQHQPPPGFIHTETMTGNNGLIKPMSADGFVEHVVFGARRIGIVDGGHLHGSSPLTFKPKTWFPPEVYPSDIPLIALDIMNYPDYVELNDSGDDSGFLKWIDRALYRIAWRDRISHYELGTMHCYTGKSVVKVRQSKSPQDGQNRVVFNWNPRLPDGLKRRLRRIHHD